MTRDEIIRQLDPLHFTTVRLEPLYDNMKLGDATGFFFEAVADGKPNFWLVTNWHVFSGRSAIDPTKVLHSKGSLPNKLRLSLILKPDQSEYSALQKPEPQFLKQEQIIDLYEHDRSAVWHQHPLKNFCDVGVIRMPPWMGSRFLINGINSVARQNDMAIAIGNNIFILGYPLGFSHFADTPIWKRGCIASEPHLEMAEETATFGGRIIIDATTRQGMSGSPVIMREKTHYLTEKGEIRPHINATRWIGIYSSRPNMTGSADLLEEDRRAEIGYVYKSGSVYKAITDGIRGPQLGELP